ncbi:LIM/homeobox protein [Schistosoma japonicum]|uniref:LIM/homeobox protein n=1 Tax=Schistosoma japonicum TaxID=6182 RepID=A0A4Z2DAR6_SCHJA|nr:LIM/homeobox protein [Schistosoma japonicum]
MLSEEDKKRNSKELCHNDLHCRGCNRQIHDRVLILLVKKSKSSNHKVKNEQIKYDKESKLSSSSTSTSSSSLTSLYVNSQKTNSNHYSRELQYLNQSETYHIHCLNCFECGDRLSFNDEKCWIHQENKVICINCRVKYKHCGRCQLQVSEDMKVHKLNHIPYHLTCFTCFQCDRQLYQGDKYGIFNNDVLCYEHYLTKCLSCKMINYNIDSMSNINSIHSNKLTEFLSEQENFTNCINEEKINQKFNQDHIHLNNNNKADRMTIMTTNCSTTSTSPPLNQSIYSNETTDKFFISSNYPTVNNLQNISNVSTTSIFTNMNRIENCQSTDNWCSLDESMLSEEILLSNGDVSLTLTENGHSIDSSTSSNCSVHSKSKRIRTSFTPDQLAILQANFDIEANPDGQELERIAGVAKLNKRVTQVWFQNARARKKKIECRGTLGGQHDQISYNSLTCCLSDSMGIEEFYDNSKENIPSINNVTNENLSINNDGMDSSQIYEREFTCKVNCYDELSHITNNDNNMSSENNTGKHFSHFRFKPDPMFINDYCIISNGNETNFTNSNSNNMEHDIIMNRLFPNHNSFGKIPFSSTNESCMPIINTIPHQYEQSEMKNAEKNSMSEKNAMTTIALNTTGANKISTPTTHVNVGDVNTLKICIH